MGASLPSSKPISSGFYFNFTNAVLDFIVWSFASLFVIFAFSEIRSYLRKRGESKIESIRSTVNRDLGRDYEVDIN